MSFDELISKQELLRGMPAKKAKTLLYLIEKQTAALAAKSQLDFSLSGQDQKDEELAFWQAYTLEDPPQAKITIQQLERFAEEWSILVPPNPQIKAAILHYMGQKYNFTHSVVPKISRVLSCHETAVKQAYYRLYQHSTEAPFRSKLSLIDWCRWFFSEISIKLESLPPFWLATLITVALGLPQAFLALPIAVAELGAISAVILLVILGAINILTTICMAEAIGRSQDFRTGNTFIKQLAENYLGKAGSLVLAIAVGIRVFLISLACYLGLSTALGNFTAIPAYVWAVILFLGVLWFFSGQSPSFSVGLTIFLAIINVAILTIFASLCIAHWQTENFLYINWHFFVGSSLKPQILDRLLGVTLMLFFGHIYVGQCAKIVLPKDPSANSLIKGSITGTAILTLLFCLWVVAVNGAIAPEVLASQTGTVIEPLVNTIGATSSLLGIMLAISLLGMAWIRSTSLLVNLAREWTSTKDVPVYTLFREQGKLVFQTRDRYDNFSLGISYLAYKPKTVILALNLQWQGKIYRQKIEVKKTWSLCELVIQDRNFAPQKLKLDLVIQSAQYDRVCLKVNSSLAVSYQEVEAVKSIITNSKSKSKKRNSKTKKKETLRQKIIKHLSNQRQAIATNIPIFLVFLLTEIVFLFSQQSFTSILGFAGVLGNSLVGGIFPVLLLISSRRKGEFLPNTVFEFLSSPWLMGGIYSFALSVIVSHGLLIWTNPLAKIGAFSIAFLSLGATLTMILTGAFIPRTFIEIQTNPADLQSSLLKITSGGKPRITKVKLGYSSGEEEYYAASIPLTSLSSLEYVMFQLSIKQPQELKVWLRDLSSSNIATPLPKILEIHQENQVKENQLIQFDLNQLGGKLLFPLSPSKYWCKLNLS